MHWCVPDVNFLLFFVNTNVSVEILGAKSEPVLTVCVKSEFVCSEHVAKASISASVPQVHASLCRAS